MGLFRSIPSLTRKEKRLSPIDGLMPDPAKLPEGCCFHPRCLYADDICKNVIRNYQIQGTVIKSAVFTWKRRKWLTGR